MTHDGWYALPKWERELWLAREVYKEETLYKLADSLRDKHKNTLNPHGLNAYVLIQAMMV